MPIQIVVGAQIRTSGLPPDVAETLVDSWTIDNPALARKARLGLWTGAEPDTLCLAQMDGQTLVSPRGTFHTVHKAAVSTGQVVHVTDATVLPALASTPTADTLYPYQQDALEQLLLRRSGCLSAPTGSGKTNILLSIIPRLNTPTLILTHTTGLLQQTAQRCHEWLGVEPGLIGSGTWNVQPVTVAMIQTLVSRGTASIAAQFGCVIVDEAHHAPCATIATLLETLPAAYRYGVTATPWRKDGLHPLIWQLIGPVTATIDAADVVAAGKTIRPRIVEVPSDFFYPLVDSLDWGRMIGHLILDPARNTLIVETVANLRLGTKALILVDRISHARVLARLLAAHAPVLLTGDQSRTAIAAGLSAVRAGAPLTIATAALLGEGIDVPGWDVLVLASPFAGGTRTVQAVGRVTRACLGKSSATVYDITDPRVPALVSARYARTAALRKGGLL